MAIAVLRIANVNSLEVLELRLWRNPNELENMELQRHRSG